MRHIHTSIVSGHIATGGTSGILRTPPPHTRRALARHRADKSPFLKSCLHGVDAGTHPSPLCPLCDIRSHDAHHLFNCTHMRTTLSPLDLWTDRAEVTALLARWTEKLAGGPQAGTSDSPHQQGSWEWVDNNNNKTEHFEVLHKASNKRNALDVDKRTDGKKKQIPDERIAAVRMSWIRANLFPITQWIFNQRI